MTASKDLTNILNKLGVNIEETIQENGRYTRIRDQRDCIVSSDGDLAELLRIRQNHTTALGITQCQIDSWIRGSY